MESRKLHSERACLVAPCQFELPRCGELQPFPISSKEKSCYRLLKSTVRLLLNLSHPSNLAGRQKKEQLKCRTRGTSEPEPADSPKVKYEPHRRLAPVADLCVRPPRT